MSERLKKMGVPVLPSVNLLPKDIAEKRKMRAVQFTALLAVLIAIAVVVVGYVIGLGAKQLAQNDLNEKRDLQTAAIAERDAKASVYDDYLTQEREEFTLAQIGYGEILYSQYAPGILTQADEQTSFETLKFLGPSALGLGGVSDDPVFGGGIGTVAFEVRAESVEAATAIIARLETVPGLARVWGHTEVYESEGGEPYWFVEGSALITPTPLTLRLVPQDGLTGIDPTLFANPDYDPEADQEPLPQVSPDATAPEEGS